MTEEKFMAFQEFINEDIVVFHICNGFKDINRNEVQRALENDLMIFVYNKAMDKYHIVNYDEFKYCYIPDVINDVIQKIFIEANRFSTAS